MKTSSYVQTRAPGSEAYGNSQSQMLNTERRSEQPDNLIVTLQEGFVKLSIINFRYSQPAACSALIYAAVQPPSMVSTDPVTNSASGEHK
jgi:hypothetical protein